MAASVNDQFMKTGENTATTLSAPGLTSGGTSINVASTTNWPTDTKVTFAIDSVTTVAGKEVQTEGTYTEYEGIVASGTSITNMTLVEGTAQSYSAGSSTRVYIPLSAYQNNELVDGLLVSHNQDGTLKADSVDTQSVQDGAVTTAKVANDAVTTGKVADGAVTTGKMDLTDYPVFYRESTASYDVNAASFAATGTSASVEVPSWATSAVIQVQVSGAYQVNTSTSDSTFRVTLGGTASTDFYHRNSGYANNVVGTCLVTSMPTGTQTLALQAYRNGGSGSVRLNASVFNGTIFFR